MSRYIFVSLLFLELLTYTCTAGKQLHQNASESLQSKAAVKGKKWALLVAGSDGWGNYRHQADICHAYQILKKGGLKDKNIIVFMNDDIAFNEMNPRPGVIINYPNGDDVYEGVPKDYTGNNATIQNLFAVILGNKSGVTGGSGKVLNTGPKDTIFIYYADHGAPGLILMPGDQELYAEDLNKVLKKKHEIKGYESMVFYLEACDSGSMFEGLLPENLNIYATTAANSTGDSYATYCGSPGYEDNCLGDTYSVSWMEDSERHDLRLETLEKQFQMVKWRTLIGDYGGSHVMQYGNLLLGKKSLDLYMGNNPANINHNRIKYGVSSPTMKAVRQRDADLLYYKQKFNSAPKGSKRWLEAKMKLLNEINSRKRVDNNIKQLSTLLFGSTNGIAIMQNVRPAGQPLVDDWSCLKTFMKTYQERCGILSTYGRKYTRAFSNMCNVGTTTDQFVMAVARICK